jgi:hypothetical protein
MRHLALLPSLFIVMSSNSVASCDLAGAARLQDNLAQLSSWKESKKGVEVTWNKFFATQPPEKARKLIETFANVDACLTGKAREIRFFSDGQLVGKASPDTGIVVADYLREGAQRAALLKAPVLTVRGKPIRVGMTSDDVVAILKNSEMVEQEVKADPALAGSLLLTKQYNAGGKHFTLVLARGTMPGPYLVRSILLAPR